MRSQSTRSQLRLFVATGILGCLGLGAPACGKDEKPPEPAVEEAPVSAADPAKDKDKDKDEDAGAKHDDDAATKDEDAGKKSRARDRLTNRRPPPKRDRHDKDAEGDTEGAAAAEGDASAVAAGDAGPGDGDKKPAEPLVTDLKHDGPKVAGGEPGTAPIGEPDIKGEPPVDGGAPIAGDPADGPGSKVAGEPGGPPHLTKGPHDPIGNGNPSDGKTPDAKTPAMTLDAKRLLPLLSVTDLTQAKGLADVGALPGIAPGPGYVSVHYRGAAADKFGVALQVWQDPARREADDRFRRMRLQYPNAEDVTGLPVKTFFARFGDIQMLTFVDSVKRVVATVACAEGICTHEQLTKLAKAVRERL